MIVSLLILIGRSESMRVKSEVKTCTTQQPQLGHGRYIEHCGPSAVFSVLLATKLFEKMDCLQCGDRLPVKLSTRKYNKKAVIIKKRYLSIV